MKIIDEKGKLFGKINIIDFLVIIFLLCFIPMTYFGYKIFSKKPTQGKYLLTEKQMSFIFKGIRPDTLKLIALNDRELDENSQSIGQIIWVGKAMQHRNVFDNGLGAIRSELDPVLKDLPVTLKLKVEVRDNGLYYKNKKIVAGEPIYFKTDKYTLDAFLYIEEKIDVFLTLKDLKDEQLRLISVGDKELGEDGDIAFEILSLGKAENDKLEINLGGGKFISGENSARKQISIRARLKCNFGKDAKLYFKGEELSDNSLFQFITDKYSVIGKIQSTYGSMAFKEKWARIQVKFSGVLPEVASIIKKEDTEMSPDNIIMAKIIDIVASKAGDVLTVKDDKFLIVSNPYQKDIVVLLDILCFEKDGTLYFKNYPVKMGNLIMFSTDIYSLTGVIIGFENR